MKFRLKKGQENIQVMSGPLAGRKYVRGEVYAEIPPEERRRFEKVPEPKAATEKKTAKSATKPDAGGGE